MSAVAATPASDLLDDPLALSKALIQRASVTPKDADCQRLLADLLQPLGFEIHWLYAGEVSNFWACRRGSGTAEQAPHLMFLGHTDVVPPGDLAAWSHDPFDPIERDGFLYGRGAADMKAAVASMVVAMARFVRANSNYSGAVSLLLTSDEEGPADHGVRMVAPWLEQQGLLPDYCLVGEPSCHTQLGDTIRIGRRGSIHGSWHWRGVQGHTAYIDPADNPLHKALRGMAAITETVFDEGDDAFPATRLNMVRVLSDSGANNITPSQVQAGFNIRNNPLSSAEDLHRRIGEVLAKADATPDEFQWKVSGHPFRTAGAKFQQAVSDAIERFTGVTPDANTGGGTSDGRFLAPLGVEVVEFGLINQTIHKVDECTEIEHIHQLSHIYQALCEQLLS